MGPGALRKGLEGASACLRLAGSAGFACGPGPGDLCAQLERLADGLYGLAGCAASPAGGTALGSLQTAWAELFCMSEPQLVHLVGQVVQGQHAGPSSVAERYLLVLVLTLAAGPGGDHAVCPRLAHGLATARSPPSGDARTRMPFWEQWRRPSAGLC